MAAHARSADIDYWGEKVTRAWPERFISFSASATCSNLSAEQQDVTAGPTAGIWKFTAYAGISQSSQRAAFLGCTVHCPDLFL